jgi:hypothetical protein
MELHDPWPEARCPICDYEEWRQVPFGVGQVEPPPAAIKAYRLPHEVGAAPFACARCGFVRLHVKFPG